MKLRERIAGSISKSGLSQSELADKIGLLQKNISDMVRGSTKNPKIDVLIKLAEICEVDLKWLLTGKGEMMKSEPIKIKQEDLTLIPILGNIPAGLPSDAEEVRDGHVPYMTKETPNGAFALKVVGDSMEPELMKNDIVICYSTQLINLKGNGEIVAVRYRGSESVIKCLYIEKERIILTPFNPKYKPIIVKCDDIDVIAKVLSKIKKYK
jgi:repressor LexA